MDLVFGATAGLFRVGETMREAAWKRRPRDHGPGARTMSLTVACERVISAARGVVGVRSVGRLPECTVSTWRLRGPRRRPIGECRR